MSFIFNDWYTLARAKARFDNKNYLKSRKLCTYSFFWKLRISNMRSKVNDWKQGKLYRTIVQMFKRVQIVCIEVWCGLLAYKLKCKNPVIKRDIDQQAKITSVLLFDSNIEISIGDYFSKFSLSGSIQNRTKLHRFVRMLTVRKLGLRQWCSDPNTTDDCSV